MIHINLLPVRQIRKRLQVRNEVAIYVASMLILFMFIGMVSLKKFSTIERLTVENKSLKDIVPTDPKKTYDVKDILTEVLDKKSFFETHAHYAQNAVTGFGRLNNSVVGIVANQPKIQASCT